MRKLLTIITLVLMAATGFSQEPTDSIPALAADSTASPATPSSLLPSPRTTPVDIDDNKRQPVLHYYDKHGEPLEEPVLFLATLDTVTQVKAGPAFPLYNGVNVGVNFGDLIFMAFGQKHASFDVWANVSLHNWFFPTLECGLGFADDTPAKNNFSYRTKPSFYAKIGFNYNFLYKSNPDYQIFLGLRAGFSSFSYDVTDITIDSDYWGESQRLDLKGLRSTSFYGEALAGIQVRIVSHFSLGWTLRWHFPFYTSKDRESKPWFIPGYGGSESFGMTVSAIWTIPSRNKAIDPVPPVTAPDP